MTPLSPQLGSSPQTQAGQPRKTLQSLAHKAFSEEYVAQGAPDDARHPPAIDKVADHESATAESRPEDMERPLLDLQHPGENVETTLPITETARRNDTLLGSERDEAEGRMAQGQITALWLDHAAKNPQEREVAPGRPDASVLRFGRDTASGGLARGPDHSDGLVYAKAAGETDQQSRIPEPLGSPDNAKKGISLTTLTLNDQTGMGQDRIARGQADRRSEALARPQFFAGDASGFARGTPGQDKPPTVELAEYPQIRTRAPGKIESTSPASVSLVPASPVKAVDKGANTMPGPSTDRLQAPELGLLGRYHSAGPENKTARKEPGRGHQVAMQGLVSRRGAVTQAMGQNMQVSFQTAGAPFGTAPEQDVADPSVIEARGSLMLHGSPDGIADRIPGSPAPAAETAARAGAIHLAQAVARQMAEAVPRLADAALEITLNPEELGRLRLTLVGADGGPPVLHVTAERMDTQELVRRHVDLLMREFSAQGFGGLTIDLGQRHQRTPAPPTLVIGESDPAAEPDNTSSPSVVGRGPASMLPGDRVDIRL
ncbi:flagellar hook-length control protein FliK [Lutimaribacter sp. EGI FJ00015]|uniref:Flagellar hook-length control protein FliK n=1 Tax=Lutimaribacter degradans TaxID=2945989 RepID=A0ACC5ZV06_9RHOB|nr:flagellar hook-length control protein FliK [Lutimaribacter sp. EGI FJ00013]MCM2561886.1 flagellar hook-length control protein FliK [Lutimaribacter sp. EGI FJ00013]MCO0613082.1 flagellar hook-length control protein FliK [Lutimaribacter sp. EGI FJ00015]MCO0635718.1 flagellar hook-length control protein FliK [Lutimaribacter sp. EGI FJ00014]